MIASQAEPGSPHGSFGSGTKKVTYPIHAPLDAVEAYKKSEPLFVQFLLESGRLVIDNAPVRGV